MTPPLHLTRIDAARGMRRFYRLDLQPDLFGAWLLLKIAAKAVVRQ